MSRSKDKALHRLALTTGEPAGIGPDLAVMLAQRPRRHEIVALGDPDLLVQRAQQLKLPLSLRTFDENRSPTIDNPGTLCVKPVKLASDVVAGQLNSDNAGYVLSMLDDAVDGCTSRQYSAMVTGPVHKGIINDAGTVFSGHTEYIAERTGVVKPVMMLLADQLRVALATIHIPMSEVPATITGELLIEVLTVLNHDLKTKFGMKLPRILVCGLNPHAGEGGHLGREEIDIIEPALDKLRATGMSIIGPLPADTLFTPRHLDHADAVLAMYHDQGLPVLKYAGFGSAVNLTLGIPIIRTSVDHGTALDLAGLGNIEDGSLHAAIELALELCSRAQ